MRVCSTGILLLLTAAPMLAGCGGNEGTKPDPSSQETSQSRVGTPGDLDRIVVDTSTLDHSAAEQIATLEQQLLSASGAEQAELYGQLGMIYQCLEIDDAAGAAYRLAADRRPGDFRWPYLQGHLSRREGDTTKAISQFEQALQLMPADPSRQPYRVAAICWLAEFALEQGDLAEAEQHLRKVLTLNEQEAFAHYSLGRIAEQRDELEQAQRHLELASGLLPQASSIQYLLGTVYRRLGLAERAESLLEQSTIERKTLNPPDPLLMAVELSVNSHRRFQHIADELFKSGQHQQAIVFYQQALKLDASPDQFAQTYCNLGTAQLHTGDFAAASQALTRALEIAPDHTQSRFNMAVLHARNGEDIRALPHYRAIVARQPRHRDARFNLANTLARLQRYAEAQAEYERLLEIDPGNERAWVSVTRMLLLQGRHAEAAQRLESVLVSDPENPMLRHDLARILLSAPDKQVRQPDRGLALALEVVKDYPTVLHVETLAMGYAAVGEFAKAIEWQQGAIEAARREGREDLVERLEVALLRYQQGEPEFDGTMNDSLLPVKAGRPESTLR